MSNSKTKTYPMTLIARVHNLPNGKIAKMGDTCHLTATQIEAFANKFAPYKDAEVEAEKVEKIVEKTTTPQASTSTGAAKTAKG